MSIDWAKAKNNNRERLFMLLTDLKWHSHQACAREGGQRFAARMLELRKLGYTTEARPLPGTDGTAGNEYRLASLVRGAPPEKMVKVYLREQEVEAILRLPGLLTPEKAKLTDALGSFRRNKHKL